MPPFFSVIIPSFNRLSTLKKAVSSVQQQTFQDFECWVVDDASTDGTWEWLTQAKLDDRFHFFRNKTNRRQHYCRNRAIERSSAPWITFLDSDDAWLPQRLAYFAQAIQESTETGFWFSNGYWLKGEKIVGAFFDQSRPIPTGVLPGYYAVGSRFLPYVTTNVAIRKIYFDTVGLFREDMSILEDTEFYARALSAGAPVGVIRQKLSLYRLHPQQITRDYVRQHDESIIALKSGRPPREVFEYASNELRQNTALFLIKAGRPSEARVFLAREPLRLPFLPFWLMTFMPAAIVYLGKQLLHKWRSLRRSTTTLDDETGGAEAFYRRLQQQHK